MVRFRGPSGRVSSVIVGSTAPHFMPFTSFHSERKLVENLEKIF
jgi:hypothetical protein